MAGLILHHYPQSPVSEKVRVVLGIKGLAWRSVIIPRLPPKPLLMPLTGGYRLTPVLQVGADIYCDSQCIIREIDRRHPEPTLFPGGAHGMAWGVGRWTDGPLFTQAIALVFGDAGEAMPADFTADRGPLYFGSGFDVKELVRRLPETLAQLRGQLCWMDERLAGRDFMLGARPGLPDAYCYYIVWFIRGRYSKGPEFLAEFKNVVQWEARIRAIGHGRPAEIAAEAALAEATAARPAEPAAGDGVDPTGVRPGDAVIVTSLDTPGAGAVSGRVVRLARDEIAVARADGRVGDVVVHFPRVGYRLERA